MRSDLDSDKPKLFSFHLFLAANNFIFIINRNLASEFDPKGQIQGQTDSVNFYGSWMSGPLMDRRPVFGPVRGRPWFENSMDFSYGNFNLFLTRRHR